ncbi:PREDICTED: GDSL esterase/lipase At1g71691-like [Lupinus angustifolius]|uniref:GDSL esterase/lipase At1g71691-like n=1 Tax=Lupinus angustifolius TaxID=3871 RepID=UPI00092FCD6C|nr:PREDICTED: GDSL esterase/lipase At1g71691-like [Lupinus angustifolius]
MYVFGDSSVDSGNNNNRNTMAKANKYPYGIDFNNKSTGRFTNGKTFADLIADKLGLPLSPPYLGVIESERYKVVTGINYASAACGILNDTRDELYDLGGRKYVVAVSGQLGCSPSKFCDEVKNEKIKPLSDKLPKKLQELQSQLSGSSFISANPFNFFNEIKNAPEKYGFKNISKSCYVDGEPLCDNREEYYYFDFAPDGTKKQIIAELDDEEELILIAPVKENEAKRNDAWFLDSRMFIMS